MNDGLGSGLIDLTWLWVMMGILFFILIGFMFYEEWEEQQTIYEMPNGIICESKFMRGGGAFSSGSTFEFRQCEDGEKYINPEHFEEIRK